MAVVTFQLLIIRYKTMNFNPCFIWKDPNEEIDEYLRCERKWIIHHSTCSPCDWDQIGSKTCYILKVRKKISLLTDWKVSFLACKCKFYKPKNAKWRPWNQNLEVFKWKNEIYKRIELQEQIRKMESCLLPEL